MTSSDKPGNQTLIDEAPVGIFQVDKSGCYTDANPAVCEMLGYSRDELLGMSITDIASNASFSNVISRFSELKQSGHIRTEGALLHKAGHEVHVIINAVSLDEASFVAHVQDITERKEAEQELNQASEELRQVIDLIPDPIFVKNRDDEVILSNEANAALHGMTPDEMQGVREREIESDVNNIQSFDKYRKREREVIQTGESMTWEEELKDPNGQNHVFRTTRIPFTTERTDGTIGYAREVTELKEYEQKLKEQRDNLEVLNQVLRHDIRNDLQLVIAYADLLAEECDGDKITEYITTIRESADHAVGLTETAREIADVMVSATPQGQRVDLQTVLGQEVS